MNAKGSGSRGFSAIELIVVLSCIAILSAIVAPPISMYVMNRKVRAIEEKLTAIKAAVEAAQSDLGYYPVDVATGIDPGLRSKENVPASLCKCWKGPYLDAWPEDSPWGATFDYERGGCEIFDFDFVAGNEIYLEVEGAFPQNVLDSIDADLDDGMHFSGRLRHNGGSRLKYYLGEGPCWTPGGLH